MPHILRAPTLTETFTAKVTIGPVQELGTVEGVRKRIFPITGGTVSGPRLSGVVLPGGADWQTVFPDGSARVYARYTLQAHDGSLISVINSGLRYGPPEVIARIADGESVDPSLYYFRTSPQFEVAAGPHGWLTKSLFVGNAARYADHVVVAFFCIN